MLRAAIRRNVPFAMALAFLVEMPLVIFVSSRGALHVVAAYHAMDVSPDKVGWLSFFFWAALTIPPVWIACFALAVNELLKKHRAPWLTAYAGTPPAAAALYWIAWETFTNFLP
jgi:hypothetical protein